MALPPALGAVSHPPLGPIQKSMNPVSRAAGMYGAQHSLNGLASTYANQHSDPVDHLVQILNARRPVDPGALGAPGIPGYHPAGNGSVPAMSPMAPPSGHVDSGYNPATYQRSIGNTGQAAADWEAHHPGAMAKGQLPGWVQAYLASLVQSRIPAGIPAGINPLAAAAGGGLPVS